MTLTKKGLRELAENGRMILTPEQEKAILKRFGKEPHHQTWTGQDIVCQIDIYLTYGKFVKPVKVCGKSRPLPKGVF